MHDYPIDLKRASTRSLQRHSTAIADALRSTPASHSPVQPVSRIWFELSDKDAFEECVAQSLNWMTERPKNSPQPRSGVNLPASAWSAEPFDITDELGANPAKAVRLDASDGTLWAARLDWPDPTSPRSWVSEFFVEKRIGQMVRYGAQLTCVRRGPCAPFDSTRPTVIHRILERLSAEADRHPLTDRIEPTQRDYVQDLVNLLYNTDRRLPVVVLTDSDDGKIDLTPNDLARRIAGAAHIFHLPSEANKELARLIGKRMSAFNGAIRLYQPGLTETNEDPFDHPLWLRGAKSREGLLRQLASRVLPSAFLDRSSPFPRYPAVRDAVNRQALQTLPSTPAPDLSDELATAMSQVAEATEERDEWHSLAQEEQDRRIEAENEVERLKSEIYHLKIRNRALKNSFQSDNKSEKAPHRPLESYDDLEEWAEEVLGDSVYIHQSALKECKKFGHENMLGRIESALLIMRDHMTPSRATNDHEQRKIAREKLAAIGMDDSACFANRDEAKRHPKYSVPYDNETRILKDHIKYGTGYDNANQIRIYYFWDNERKRHVVGRMPSHLPNNLTN